MAFLSRAQLESMGFASLGKHVSISDKASIYGCARIALGDHVRIDDFCVISAGQGGIQLGSYIHIAIYSSLMGQGRIRMADFSGLSSRVAVYSSNDDYTGTGLTNPTVPEPFTRVRNADVSLERHVIVGCGSVILPGVILEEGVAVGALSLVHKNCQAFGIYVGNPVTRIKDRKRDLLAVEKAFLESLKDQPR